MRTTVALMLEFKDWLGIGSLVLGMASILVSLIALKKSQRVQARMRTITLYSDIDKLYFGLLSLAINHPSFVDPEHTDDYERKFQGEEKTQYELYAFNAWNICETIFDREDDKLTFESWEPVLALESTLHQKWFFDSDLNRNRFKQEFVTYMQKNRNRLQKLANSPHQLSS